MKKFPNYFNKYLIILVFIAAVSHLQWLNPFSILNFADWSYWPNEAVSQLYYSYGTWLNFLNFGSANIQLTFNFFTSIWSFFANLGFSYDFATKITLLIPIAILGFIAPYVLYNKLTKNESISFIVALFYGTTTYFLIRQTSHIPIALVYALAPMVLYFFIRSLKKNKLANWIAFVLIFWVSACYEIRITYIVTFLLFFYFIFFYISDIKKYWKNILVSVVAFVGLNIFWLLLILSGGSADSISVVANRGLFGNFLVDIKNALSLSESAWTGGLVNNQFIKQSILWYFWLIPIIVFSVFLFRLKKFKYKKEILFFSVVSLVGIFLTKQAAEPLAGAYLWLYNNFPGFNLFREASKFYLLTALGYAGLIAYGLLALKEHKNEILNKYLFSAFSIIIVCISLWNVKPLITGEIRTMFISKNIPNDYLILKDFILKQPEYFRTMWVPRDSRWGIYTNQKPKISDIAVVGNNWKNLLETYNKNEKIIQNQILNVFELPSANNLMDISSIKYVIVPIQDIANDDNFFVSYGGEDDPNIRAWYISELDKVKFLERFDIGTKELVVYENANYRPHIYATKETETIYHEIPYEKVDFYQKNPTEYKIYLKNISKSFYLNFSESFHPDWKIRAGEFHWFDVLTQKNYFLPDDFHTKNNANLSTFKIDPNFIKENPPTQSFLKVPFRKQDSQTYYTENPDGSINVELTLYFKPQSYFYLGLIISGTTLIACLGYLGYDFVIRRRRKTATEEELPKGSL